jgi:hypothetical protein
MRKEVRQTYSLAIFRTHWEFYQQYVHALGGRRSILFVSSTENLQKALSLSALRLQYDNTACREIKTV